LTLFAVSDCRRDTREHLMLEFSENPHSRFVVTNAPGDPDPYRGDRRIAGGHRWSRLPSGCLIVKEAHA
jgi:hypothetical protein